MATAVTYYNLDNLKQREEVRETLALLVADTLGVPHVKMNVRLCLAQPRPIRDVRKEGRWLVCIPNHEPMRF